jgi:hypothetical protein
MKLYVRMFIYIGITALITFATLLDTFTNEQIFSFTKFDWVKLSFKSFIPSLVALKAYLDNTVHETLYNEPQSPTPINLPSTQDIVQNLTVTPILTPTSTTTTTTTPPSNSQPQRQPRAT